MIGSGATSTGFGHGKVILLGEHAVVAGQPALAAGLRAGVRAHATPGKGVLSAPAWGLDAEVGDDSPPGQAVAKLLERLNVDRGSLDFWLETEIPARAGLGSSAAMAVAIARAVGVRIEAAESDIAQAVTAAESVFHRAPSGIDAAAASRGRLGRYDKASGWRDVPLSAPFEICIGQSGKSHDTGALVAGVRALCESLPTAKHVIETMGEAAQAGIAALATGDLPTLGKLFDLAHGLLCAVGVSCPELDDMVHSARTAGALGAKLTGAGGGGAIIALPGVHGDEILRGWRAKGYYGFLTTIGHD